MTRFAYALLALSLAPTPAAADPWLVAEAPAALPVSDMQASVFKPGVMPAVGAYIAAGPVEVGARVRAGILRDGAAPSDHLANPGIGGLGTAGLAARVVRGGAWIEGVAGAGITGRDLVPAFEAGVGYTLTGLSFDVGPSVRVVHVVGGGSMDTLGNADLVLVGIDFAFGKHRARAPRIEPAVERVEPVAVEEPPPAIERDDNPIADGDTSCLAEPAACPAPTRSPDPAIEIHRDRIVLDERVLFDTDHAHVKSRGRELIAEIVRMWHDHPEWTKLTIEGHTDVRGPDEYNQELSQRRADAVRAVLLRLGVEPDRVDAIGYGKTRPRDEGTTDAAHQRNRRVEFVIETGGAP